MLEIYKFVFYILCIIILTAPINCQLLSARRQAFIQVASTTEDDEMVSPPAGLVTDIPQYKIDAALKMDIGRYSTVSFHYENQQWMHSIEPWTCYDHFTRCLSTMFVSMPVCVMFVPYAYKTLDSYCIAYLHNCRVKFRYWRILGYGRCNFDYHVYGFGTLREVQLFDYYGW